MKDDYLLAGWAVVVDKIIRGDKLRRQFVSLGPTPELLTRHGLCTGGLTMTVAKLVTCRKTHPDVSLDVWRQLPALLADPLAIFPSARRDGSIVSRHKSRS